jgi:hypothetical protein
MAVPAMAGTAIQHLLKTRSLEVRGKPSCLICPAALCRLHKLAGNKTDTGTSTLHHAGYRRELTSKRRISRPRDARPGTGG